MPDQENGAFITISRREIFESFQRIEREVDSARNDLTGIKVSLGELKQDFNKRVRALELRYYGILAGLIGVVAAYAYSLVRTTS